MSGPSQQMAKEMRGMAGDERVFGGAEAAEMALLRNIVADVDIALAASGTTDGMTITITLKDAQGNTIAERIGFEWWISESAVGAGLTADSYSGSVTAGTGTILTALTAKKHFLALSGAAGIFVATAVDSANPADQYVCVRNPTTGRVHVSAVSGTNWEGA